MSRNEHLPACIPLPEQDAWTLSLSGLCWYQEPTVPTWLSILDGCELIRSFSLWARSIFSQQITDTLDTSDTPFFVWKSLWYFVSFKESTGNQLVRFVSFPSVDLTKSCTTWQVFLNEKHKMFQSIHIYRWPDQLILASNGWPKSKLRPLWLWDCPPWDMKPRFWFWWNGERAIPMPQNAAMNC